MSGPAVEEALSLLARVEGDLGELVRQYISRPADSNEWLKQWFADRSSSYYSGNRSFDASIQFPATLPVPAVAQGLAAPTRLVSLTPHYFRGFKVLAEPIEMREKLIVVEGGNSSGKTSLAEALEFLFTGGLSRRTLHKTNAKELEECIGNHFCLPGDTTWVEATFEVDGSPVRQVVLRRELVKDYGPAIVSECESAFYVDGAAVDASKEREVLAELFAGIPPLLMQHTLREFVFSRPRDRRDYFEALLRLDGLTALIEGAVIGVEADHIKGPSEGVGRALWSALASSLHDDRAVRAVRSPERHPSDQTEAGLQSALLRAAQIEFPTAVASGAPLSEVQAIFEMLQREARERTFPLVGALRPARTVPQELAAQPYSSGLAQPLVAVGQAWERRLQVEEAAKHLDHHLLGVARALKELRDANLIPNVSYAVTCPLCAYDGAATLTPERIATIEAVRPVTEAKAAADGEVRSAMGEARRFARRAIDDLGGYFPTAPSEKQWGDGLANASDAVRDVAEKVREALSARPELERLIALAKPLLADGPIPLTSDALDTWKASLTELTTELDGLARSAQNYAALFKALETAVGTVASADPTYKLREAWLRCDDKLAQVVDDFLWERAKHCAARDLESLRERLMGYRSDFLEARRVLFNGGIDAVWGRLRADTYSAFKRLYIPPPRQKGFPVEIEIKAVLRDGQEEKEVDALGVFSESQMNVLGIGAFLTRSRALGHKMVILDDPVQSMDEEHFRTFARDLVPGLLDEDGLQVVILTHNDAFGRQLSYWHLDRMEYTALSIRHVASRGCIVEEGTRLASQRFTRARHLAEQQGNLGDAWTQIRRGVERLYLAAMLKHGPGEFDPTRWEGLAAEARWDAGAEDIIEGKIPDSGKRLKDILVMTASGSHDKAPAPLTEIQKSIPFLQKLLNDLNLGRG